MITMKNKYFERGLWKKAAQFISLSFLRFRFVFELLAFFLIAYFFLIFSVPSGKINIRRAKGNYI